MIHYSQESPGRLERETDKEFHLNKCFTIHTIDNLVLFVGTQLEWAIPIVSFFPRECAELGSDFLGSQSTLIGKDRYF